MQKDSLPIHELGSRQICPKCNTRFYDLKKQTLSCPKCLYAFEAMLPPQGKKKSLPYGDEKKRISPSFQDEPETQMKSEDFLEDPNELGVDDDMDRMFGELNRPEDR